MADCQLSQGRQVPQMLSFCCHLSSAKDSGAALKRSFCQRRLTKILRWGQPGMLLAAPSGP
jgi:hypothetical protein